jgi:lipopolysaccharide export system permease protein
LPTIDRLIIAELAMPFVFGMVICTAIAASIGALFELVRLIAEANLGIGTALIIFTLKLPTYIVLAFPMSILLSTLLTYGNLSKSSEITALKSFGVSVYRLAIPALVASLVITGITFACNETVVPPTSYQANTIQFKAVNRAQLTYRDRNIFYREFLGDTLSRIFFARRFDGQQMQRISVLNFEQGMLDQILVAETGVWNPKQEKWDFSNGTLYSLSRDQSYRAISPFTHKTVTLPRTPLDLARETRPPIYMNIGEAQAYLRLVEQTGDQRWIRRLEVRIQEKFALPFICVAFGLVGTALGIRSRFSSNSKGFGLSVVIIFSYYLVSFVCLSLGEGGLLSAPVAAWFPKFLCFGLGLALLHRAGQ